MKWTVSKTAKGSTVIVDEKGRNVCMFGWHWPISVARNAPLIAAAPELVAALERIAATSMGDDADIATEALTKAGLR